MKAAVIAMLALAVCAGPALAGPCDQDLPKVTEALHSAQLTAEVKTQVEDMVRQAGDLCKAGNEEEAADVLSEAASLLQME